jgi:hypothetical protein
VSLQAGPASFTRLARLWPRIVSMSTLRCYQREPLAPALRLLEMRLWRKVGSLEILSSIVRMAGGELELRCQSICRRRSELAQAAGAPFRQICIASLRQSGAPIDGAYIVYFALSQGATSNAYLTMMRATTTSI